jgi:DNA-binding HxlR family transcriptional regulator
MLPRTYDAQNCSLARALEIVGERWTLLVLRDVFLGVRRFDDFQERLDVSRTVLAGRLKLLVDEGLLKRERYQERPDRFEYVLTEKGLDLWPAINALRAWGDAYATPNGAPREFVHVPCGTHIEAAAWCPHCRALVAPADVLTGPGPGYGGTLSRTHERARDRRHLLESAGSTAAPVKAAPVEA